VALQAVAAVPVYWLLVGLGTFLQFSREHAASQLAEIDLRHSLAVAQHDALKMKLQPHFLFNALNAIASLARVGESDVVVRVVDHLGTLLRLSMETSARQFVTLDEELALVDAYLAIEAVRFEDRLKVVRRIAPDARHALVPNLILQPLVENALVHGLSRRLDASLLEVAARREGRMLRIAVRDDGPGLPASWTLAADAGAGLRNVVDRIQGLFQGDGGLRIENGATGGAVAMLSIPFADAETTAVALEPQPWTA
jgi:two-component system, LytTR family, sensor kinase